MLHVLHQLNTCAVIYCFGEVNHCLNGGDVWRYLKTIDTYDDVPWCFHVIPHSFIPFMLIICFSRVVPLLNIGRVIIRIVINQNEKSIYVQ